MGWGIDETDTWPSVRPTANGMAQAVAAPPPMIATSMPGRTWAQRGLFVRMMISTRRFFCRPSGSSLPSGFSFATFGTVSPRPRAVSRAPSILPSRTSQVFTEAARASESVRL